MKFLHLSDLHIGKRVNGFSMMEDQKYILDSIISIAEEEAPDAAVIAGDVYDKAVPSAEAVELFDDFLVRLARLGIKVMVISGNHDSPERIAFGGRLMSVSGVYMSPVYSGDTFRVRLEDEFGAVSFYLLPFIKPVHVRTALEDDSVLTYTDAAEAAIRRMNIDPAERNVLAAHQLVTGAARCDSEDISVGGCDDMAAEVFKCFDYTALGHIHGAQSIGASIRYCGTPLKYSFSECSHEKSVTAVTMAEKGNVSVKTIPLVPLRDMREIKGLFSDISCGERCEDYMHVTLTDEDMIPDAAARLKAVYPNLMRIDYDNARTRGSSVLREADISAAKTPSELFGELYFSQNNSRLSQVQQEFLNGLIEDIWEGEA